MAEARQFGAGPNGASHIAGSSVGFVVIGGFAGQASGSHIQFVGLFGNLVFGEHGGKTAKAGRL